MSRDLMSQSPDELENMADELRSQYELVGANQMSLDLSRGKPAPDQLSLSEGMEDAIAGNYRSADGTDVRNYGGIRGLLEARELGAELLDVSPDEVLAVGNSSLQLMHLVVATALTKGLFGADSAWQNQSPKILAPVPGYDRHFTLTEHLGIDMLNIPMTAEGPSIDAALAAAENDPSIKGIWCVPKYSNPTGVTCSDANVDAIAELPKRAAADNFVVLWDNAYAVHDLEATTVELAPIAEAAKRHGTQDHIVQFASTSKVTFAGAGVGFIAASPAVLNVLENELQFQTIGPDKVNQLRHARFLKNNLHAHMQAHAALLQPKFAIVLDVLNRDLGGMNIATWTEPKGGYFVSLDLLPGLASKVVAMAKAVGLSLTPAGAPFPYGIDPEDKNVRIAPTFASLEDLTAAMEVLTLCVKLASVEQKLNNAENS